MALGGFEYKASSELLSYASSLPEFFEQGIGMELQSWKLNEEKNTLELTFKTEKDELVIGRLNDPTTGNGSQLAVVLSQLMEITLEMGHKNLTTGVDTTQAELQDLIGNSDWDATLMAALFDQLIGTHGRGKLTYQAAYVEYDAELPEFEGLTNEQIKAKVTPFIGFGRFPYFYKDGNTTAFKRFIDKKNAGKYSDHLDFVLKKKVAADLNLGVAAQVADSNLFN